VVPTRKHSRKEIWVYDFWALSFAVSDHTRDPATADFAQKLREQGGFIPIGYGDVLQTTNSTSSLKTINSLARNEKSTSVEYRTVQTTRPTSRLSCL
jgi:hypothetical protein